MSYKRKKKDLHSSSKEELIRMIGQLEFTVRRRGGQIGGLYCAIQTLMDNNPNTYTLRTITSDDTEEVVLNLKKELESARNHIKNLAISSQKSDPIKDEGLPRDFQCNICFENYTRDEGKDDRRPLVLECGHVICSGCFVNGVKKPSKPVCPFCRKEVTKVIPLYI